MEEIVKHYYGRLQDETNPAYLLGKFYCEAFEIQFTMNYVKMLAKLIRMYGRLRVFNAILDLAGNRDLDHTNTYGLLNYMCKKSLEKEVTPITNLSNLIKEHEEKIEKTKNTKLRIRSPFDE
jgi:hypothetical protein